MKSEIVSVICFSRTEIIQTSLVSFFIPIIICSFIFIRLVTSGLCDDPLHGTDIYFYGDSFKCDSTFESFEANAIKCVPGSSTNHPKWGDALSICQGNDYQII